jgi:hypothetical protein
MKFLSLLFRLVLCLVFASCNIARRTTDTTTADGTRHRQSETYSQLGGVGGYASTAGGMAVQFDGQKSFRDAAILAGVVVPAGFAAQTERAASAAAAATRQTEVKSAAEVAKAQTAARASTATALGGNPEANVGAVDAVGRLFR